MAKNKNTRTARILATEAGIRGVSRAEALAVGGQQALIYRSAGVKATRTTDRRKAAAKSACRGRIRP